MKELTLTNHDVVVLDKALAEVGKIKAHPKFSMKVALNRQILKPYIEAIGEAQEMDEAMKAYTESRSTLFKKHGNDNGDGTITIEAGARDAFDKELKELNVEHKSAIEAYENQLIEFNEKVLPEKINEGNPIKMHEFPKRIPSEIEGNLLFSLIDLLPENAGD